MEQQAHTNTHILSLSTDNNPSWMIQRKGGEWLQNYFMINLHESAGPDRDRTQPLDLQSDKFL